MIELCQVVKRYPTRSKVVTVLNGIDLRVHPGEKLGILGRNGAGKSTLVRLLSGAERPCSGIIERGMRVSWPLAFAGGFQGSLTGLDNFKFICRVYGVDHESRLAFVEDFTELGAYLREPMKTYSSGMRARLGFAVSMSIEFDCYLIDEVIAVGDSRFHQKCEHELFQRRADRALIMVSHMPDLLRKHCQRFAVLRDGQLHPFDNADSAYAFHEGLAA